MTDQRPALGRPWQRIVDQTIREEPDCRLRYPGICTGHSQTADHITPRSQGGPDTRDNTRGACHPCNQHRSDHPDPTTDTDRHSRQWT